MLVAVSSHGLLVPAPRPPMVLLMAQGHLGQGLLLRMRPAARRHQGQRKHTTTVAVTGEAKSESVEIIA